MRNRKTFLVILALLCMLPFLGFVFDNLYGSRETPHDALVFRIRMMFAIPGSLQERPLRTRLRPLLEKAGETGTAFVWDEPAGRIILGDVTIRDAIECWNRMPPESFMHDSSGWVCGRHHGSRWAVEKKTIRKSDLPAWWWKTTFLPILALSLFWMDLRRKNRQNRQLAETARQLAQGLIPRMPVEVETSEAFAVMAASLREKEERLALNLSVIETQNREILENRTRIVEQEKLATLGHLAGGLAHELGNPLSALFSHVELLSDTAVDPEQLGRHMELMKKEVHRMDALVRALLQLARDRTVPEERQTVEQAFSEAREILSGRQFAEVKHELEVGPDILETPVPVDLKQVLVNLFLNAGLAMDGRGTIRVTARREGTELVLDVVDSGPGVPPGQEDRIFEPFFTTRDPGEGTGLGLSLSRMILTRAGGSLVCLPHEAGGHFRIIIVLPD